MEKAVKISCIKRCKDKVEKNIKLDSYFHHKEDGVKDNEDHDEVFKRGGHDHPPDLVLKTVHLTRHVPLQRSRLDGKVDASFLKKMIRGHS